MFSNTFENNFVHTSKIVTDTPEKEAIRIEKSKKREGLPKSKTTKPPASKSKSLI